MPAIYDVDKFELFALSRHCITFDRYYRNFYNSQHWLYLDHTISFDDTYFVKVFTMLDVYGDYCSMFWMRLRALLPVTGKKVKLIYMAGLMEYITEVLTDYASSQSGSSMFLRLEYMKVIASNRKRQFMYNADKLLTLSKTRLMDTIKLLL